MERFLSHQTFVRIISLHTPKNTTCTRGKKRTMRNYAESLTCNQIARRTQCFLRRPNYRIVVVFSIVEFTPASVTPCCLFTGRFEMLMAPSYVRLFKATSPLPLPHTPILPEPTQEMEVALKCDVHTDNNEKK